MCPTSLGRKEKKLSNVHIVHCIIYTQLGYHHHLGHIGDCDHEIDDDYTEGPHKFIVDNIVEFLLSKIKNKQMQFVSITFL